MTPEKPYEWGHPQFDVAIHRRWREFLTRETYVDDPGLSFLPPKRESLTQA
jgi:hypothetical protein